MAAFDDVDARLVDQLRRGPVVLLRMFRQRVQGVELGQALRNRLQGADVRRQLGQQQVVQQFFAHQGLVLRRQGLVFEHFQFRRDVALGVFQGLAAAVVVRHLVRLAVRDFNIEAVHLVVFDAQVGDARACAFARFQVEQELARVFRQRAQLVQFGVKAGGKHAAVAHHGSRLLCHCAYQQVQAGGRCCQSRVDGGQQTGFAALAGAIAADYVAAQGR